jgi:hypothetical protein
VHGISTHALGASLDHGHSGGYAERRNGLGKKGTPPSPRFDEGPQAFGPGQGEHDAGHAGTRAEVGGPPGRLRDSCEPEGVLERVFYGAGTEEPSALALS